MNLVRVAVVGCGNISGIYFKNLGLFKRATVVACADIDLARAAAAAEAHSIPFHGSVESVLEHPDVDLVLNLTIPSAHYPVAKQALLNGKSAYNEKPLAAELAEGQELLKLAAEHGGLIGGAPDTFMGAGLQTCRELIDAGAIGKPIGCNAFMLGRGPENWHPAPGFFYQRGGGPLFDMGPYYITALVSLLGPISKVAGFSRASFAEREITRGELEGTRLPVETPTHIIGALSFRDGVIGQIGMSFDVWSSEVPRIEIYGSEGTLSVPDPNNFGGAVRIWKPGKDWEDVPVTRRFHENSRGLGVLDLGLSLQEGRKARASGELALHVLETMHGILTASEMEATVTIQSQPERPEPLAATGPADDI